MGGDRTCPDNCLLASWHSLPDDQKTPARRRPIVEQLRKQDYSQQAIARQLGVSQDTISNDCETLTTVVNVKGRGKDTLGRKKSAGRPKGSGQRRSGPQPARRTTEPQKAQAAATLVLDRGMTYEQAKNEVGLKSVQPVKVAVAEENIRREPQVARADLSMTAQQKVDAWKRQEQRKLEGGFEERVMLECRRRLNDVSLPSYLQQLKDLERSIANRKGVMDGVTYKKILACLHPDRLIGLLASTEDERPRLLRRYEEAFRLFTELEKRVLDEKESPTAFRRDIPRTYEELMAAREKVRAANRERAMRGKAKASVSVR
jgi:hypothetical protein